MSNSNLISSRISLKALIAILFVVIFLSSCGVGSFAPSASNNPPPSPAVNLPTYPSGFTTFIPDGTSRVIHVSSTGNDANDGLTEGKPVKTIAHGSSLTRAGEYDFLLFKRGDVWRDQRLSPRKLKFIGVDVMLKQLKLVPFRPDPLQTTH